MTFRPRLGVLPAAQRQLWPALADVPEPFVLYGGTRCAGSSSMTWASARPSRRASSRTSSSTVARSAASPLRSGAPSRAGHRDPAQQGTRRRSARSSACSKTTSPTSARVSLWLLPRRLPDVVHAAPLQQPVQPVRIHLRHRGQQEVGVLVVGRASQIWRQSIWSGAGLGARSCSQPVGAGVWKFERCARLPILPLRHRMKYPRATPIIIVTTPTATLINRSRRVARSLAFSLFSMTGPASLRNRMCSSSLANHSS